MAGSDQVPVSADRDCWRDQVIEAALEPELPIVDAHHHLWDVPRRARLEPYPPAAFLADLAGSGHRVVATVYVDAFANYATDGPEYLRPVGETVYVDRVARAAAHDAVGPHVCAAIVANGDLMLGSAVGEVLDAHAEASRNFRGVRRMTLHDAEMPGGMVPGMMATPAFRTGMAEVARRGLTFDACVFPSQLPELTDLARAFPGTTMILNHLGTPLDVGRYALDRDSAFAAWRSCMAELATCDNVVVKIGGLNMPFTGLGAGDDADRPLTSGELANRQRRHVLTTIDLFGANRCMFESNFPVDRWYTSYTVLWNCFKRIVFDFTADDRAELFAGSARRIYAI